MKLLRSFWRAYDFAGPEGELAPAWMQRMDSLLASDPLELLDFVSDALLSIVAKQNVKTEEEYRDAFKMLLDGMLEATLQDGTVVELVRNHWLDVAAKLSEMGITKEMMYERARQVPWPEDVTSNAELVGND